MQEELTTILVSCIISTMTMIERTAEAPRGSTPAAPSDRAQAATPDELIAEMCLNYMRLGGQPVPTLRQLEGIGPQPRRSAATQEPPVAAKP